jgi:hypothetical protein
MTTIVDLPKPKKKTKFGEFLKNHYENESFLKTLAFRQKRLKEKEDEFKSPK